jgi:hypothetical protein
MLITIPKKIEHAIRIPVKDQEKELKKLLALKLYKKRDIGNGKGQRNDRSNPDGIYVSVKK